MTFATLTNIILILLCGAVLVQSVRMMRSFETVKNGGLKDTVEALDKATSQARLVLGDLKDTLRSEGAATARSVAKGEEMREELTVMVGIANAVAERIVQTVEASPKPHREPAQKPDSKPEPKTEIAPAAQPRTETAPVSAKPQRPRVKAAPRSKRGGATPAKDSAAVGAL